MRFPRLKMNAKAIIQSFYSPPLYRDVIYNWKGFGGLYVLLLAFVLAFITAVILGIFSMQFKKHGLPNILAQVPNMVIEDGVLLVQSLKQPVEVKADELSGLKNKGMILAYINTLAPEEELVRQQGRAVIIMGYDSMYMMKADGYTKKSYEGFNKFRITPNAILEHWPGFGGIVLFFTIILTFGMMLNILMLAVLIAVCSYIVTAFMKEEYDFETRMRIAVIALTPPLLLSKIVLLVANHATATWFDVLLSVFYFYIIIISTRQPAIKKDAG